MLCSQDIFANKLTEVRRTLQNMDEHVRYVSTFASLKVPNVASVLGHASLLKTEISKMKTHLDSLHRINTASLARQQMKQVNVMF